jgi:hypothetical protein
VEACDVDPRVWTGAFATNVWGGRYEMDGFLGAGGQGATFVGTDRKTGARVAVKVFDLKNAKDWKAVELFEREAKTLQEIEHPGMPQFIDVIEDDGARALVMTLVHGQSYDRVLKEKGPVREAALWRVLVDVTDVLRELHGQDSPVVHRDIKPRNLVRRPDGGVALVDFGGVAVRSTGSTVVGTFGYMAPEQLYGKTSPATDMYCLGATLLTLATGTEPEDQPRQGLAIDVDKAVPHLSAPLRGLLKRLLAPEPEKRPQTAAALAKELNAIYDAATGRSLKSDRETARKANDFDIDADEIEKMLRRQMEELQQKFEKELTDKDREDMAEAANVLGGIVNLVVGILGTVATVILGEILLPIAFAIAVAVAQDKDKEKVKKARASMRSGVAVAREGFGKSIDRGATALKKADERDKLKKAQRKLEDKMRRQQQKQDARAARRGRGRRR